MKLLILIAFFLSSGITFAQTKIDNKTLRSIVKLAGSYHNTRGATAEVKVSFLNNHLLDFNVEVNSGNYYLELNFDNYKKVDRNGDIVFDITPEMCDYPGCTDLQGDLKFVPKVNGSYYIAVEAIAYTNTLDADVDLSLSGKQLVNALQKFCESTYGKEAKFVGKSIWGSCEYELNIYLTQK